MFPPFSQRNKFWDFLFASLEELLLDLLLEKKILEPKLIPIARRDKNKKRELLGLKCTHSPESVCKVETDSLKISYSLSLKHEIRITNIAGNNIKITCREQKV